MQLKEGRGYFGLQVSLKSESIMTEVAEHQVARAERSHHYPYAEIRQNKPNMS